MKIDVYNENTLSSGTQSKNAFSKVKFHTRSTARLFPLVLLPFFPRSRFQIIIILKWRSTVVFLHPSHTHTHTHQGICEIQLTWSSRSTAAFPRFVYRLVRGAGHVTVDDFPRANFPDSFEILPCNSTVVILNLFLNVG